jgi:hypothetical protein
VSHSQHRCKIFFSFRSNGSHSQVQFPIEDVTLLPLFTGKAMLIPNYRCLAPRSFRRLQCLYTPSVCLTMEAQQRLFPRTIRSENCNIASLTRKFRCAALFSRGGKLSCFIIITSCTANAPAHREPDLSAIRRSRVGRSLNPVVFLDIMLSTKKLNVICGS